MIDGVKIDVPSMNANEWLNNRLLDFYAYTNTKTGELYDGTLVATYKGLKFFITQSVKYPTKVYCSVRGSLHKYFNKGKHNANDFTIEDLQNIIIELQQKFNIDPATAILRNVEFGVNLHTPITASELLKNLVSYGSYPFVTLKIESVTLGKVVKKQQANLKIYDKGLQCNLPAKNLVRFELAVKKMAYLNSYGITTLANLSEKDKIKPLGSLLLSYWDDIIYYDKKVNWKQLTPFERKKLLYYATPRNWEDFDRMQRYRAKKHFRELIRQYSTSTTHQDIHDLIAEKVENITASFCRRFNHDLEAKNQNQNVDVLTVNIHGYNVDKNKPQNDKVKKVKNPPKKKRVCKVCQSSISHKKTQAKYCSKRCNNKLNGMKRTQRRQKATLLEKRLLERLLKNLGKNRLILLVTYQTEVGEFSDHLHQSEIHTTKNWLKRVNKVVVTGHRKNSEPITLTQSRARKLIRIINKFNH